MGARIAAEVFPPGEFLKDELEARGWTQAEFAEIIGKDTRLVSEVMSGKRAVTPETAVALGQALGTGAEIWMNLESQYQLSKIRSIGEDSISRKAKLHSIFPVREMIKRGWIESSKNIDILENQVKIFFSISSFEETPAFLHAAKKKSYENTSIHQIAWLCRANELAKASIVQKFSESKVKLMIEELRQLAEYADGARLVATVLAKYGVKFVIVESLTSCKIDGACFWIEKTPVIAMSLRFDRIDNFWHTLFHELDHIANGEGMLHPILDLDIQSNDDKPANEIRANETAAEILIPRKEFEGFIARVSPMFSDEAIVGFARRMQVHPGIVVGQLQNRGLLPWSFHRKKLEKIRDFVIGSALTDGFGRMVDLS